MSGKSVKREKKHQFLFKGNANKCPKRKILEMVHSTP
jgi:hypothetical protein